MVMSGEETGIDIDLSVVEELKGYFGELVLFGGRTNDIGADKLLELLRSQKWLELKGLADSGLSDGEGPEVGVGSH